MKKIFSLSVLAIVAFLTFFGAHMAANNDKEDNESKVLTITVAPAKVYCDSLMNSECLSLTVKDSNQTLKVKSIHGFNFNKGNSYVLEIRTKEKIDNNMITSDTKFTLMKEVSRTFDPQVCSNKTYSDGCNTCTLGNNGQSACTERACFWPGIPSCNNDEPLVTIACTKEYNPVCDSAGKSYSNACMAEAAGLAAIEYASAYCSSTSAERAATIKRAHSHGITQFDTEAAFMGNTFILRAHAAKMFALFAKAYSKNTIRDSHTDRQCSFNDIRAVSSDLRGHISQSCKFGLFLGYRSRFMPNGFLTRAQAKIVLARLISNDTTASATLDAFFIDKDMNQSITRLELIMVMEKLYNTHSASSTLMTVRGKVTEYDASPIAYDGAIIFSIDNVRYDIGGGLRVPPEYDTTMIVREGRKTSKGTLSQYSNRIEIGDRITATLPRGSTSLYNCKDCTITLIK